MSPYSSYRLPASFRAPFTLPALLACAVACGSASAQSTTDAAQRTSQSNSTTQNAKLTPVQLSDRGYVGVYLGEVNVERARDLGLKEIRGVVVGKVEAGSPAANAGLRENDVILTFNSERVQNRDHFHHLLISSQPGSAVSLEISRGGVEQRLELVLGQRRLNVSDPCQRLFNEANAHLASAAESHKLAEEAQRNGQEDEARRFLDEEKMFRQMAEESRAYIEGQIRDGKIPECHPSHRPEHNTYNLNANRYRIGVSVTPLTAQLAGFFNAAQDSALITEVRAGGLGERVGLKAGDCVVTINGKPVKSTSDIDRLLNQESSGELEFVIVRDRSQQKIRIKLDQN